MNAKEELMRRLALKRRRKLGTMSDEAFSELELAVHNDPFTFVDDEEEQAFALVMQAIGRLADTLADDEFLDDEQFMRARQKRLDALASSCKQALKIDANCIDAQLLLLLSRDYAQEELFEKIHDMHDSLTKELGSISVPPAGDAWADVFMRPRLRLQTVLAQTAINTTRFCMAKDYCLDLLTRAPLDAMGARYTCALAMARLEDEEGLEWLDTREGRHGNAWFHIGRAILMYKLGRIPAARRALRGFNQLCKGGAYLLLQPTYVDVYLPDRPAFEPGSFEESMLCLHEADPILADIPDFAAWARDQPGFLASAQDFCQRNGFEWRDWED